MKISKKISYITIGIVLALSTSVLAASWQGTSWIASGNIIDATKTKLNFDYLYERSWDKDGSDISYQAGGIKGKSIALSAKGTSAVTIPADIPTTLVTKGFVDTGISNVTNLVNTKAPTPATLCTGNKYLQWDGTNFSCKTIVIPAAATPKCNLDIQSAWLSDLGSQANSRYGPVSTGYNGNWSIWIRTGKGASTSGHVMSRFAINCY